MIGEPGRYDPAIFADQPGGDDEIHWFRACLEGLNLTARIDLHGVRACRDESLPPPGRWDAAILGGSFHSVHESRPWQRMIVDWLRAYRAHGRPLLAICGGHQLVAHMDGAPVAPLNGAPAAGSVPVRLTDAGQKHFLFDGYGDAPVFHFANSEHVGSAPAGARILATADRMPCAVLDHGGGWYGVQFHPEATHDLLAATWRSESPPVAPAYRPIPEATRLIGNFLVKNNRIEYPGNEGP